MRAHVSAWYLDSFSKSFGANKVLGESFWRQVVEMNFSISTTKLPMLRTAFICTNLTSPKVVDGVARLLAKIDLLALCRKDRLLDLQAADSLLADAWQRAQGLMQHKQLQATQGYQLIGRMSVRTVLRLTKEWKDGLLSVIMRDMNKS